MIPLKRPDHWSAPIGMVARTFYPLSLLWQCVHKFRLNNAIPYHAKIPVVCIGNVVTGGVGKTPTAVTLHNLLKSCGFAKNICFLSRGYGGRIRGPLLIPKDSAPDTAQCGDEPAFLSRHGPVIIAANRPAGLRMAEEHGFDCVICDDGFQNPSFAKDYALLVFDGRYGAGNGLCIPSGPLRERMPDALSRADAVIIVGADENELKNQINIPVYDAALIPQNKKPHKDTAYVAFAGIGAPDKFFETLRMGGYDLKETLPYADHHPYDDHDLGHIQRIADKYDATLITTEKDHIRLNAVWQKRVETFPVTMEINDAANLLRAIKEKIQK